MKLIANLANVDRQTTLQTGISAAQLMENAGTQVALRVQNSMAPQKHGVVVCGPGNNGGDGFVCARKLYESGYRNIRVIYTGKQYQNESLENLESLLSNFPMTVTDARAHLAQALAEISQADFVVDALFGSGLNRNIEGLEAALIEAINQRSQADTGWVLAVDMPSGIDSTSGAILGVAVKANQTITFAVGKPGLYLHPGKSHAGSIQVADIGIPTRLLAEEPSPYRLIDVNQARSWLTPRQPDSHKYHYGHVLVIAGSQTMPGAAVLCAEAAASCGAGLVTLASVPSVFQQVPCAPEIMRLPLPDLQQLGPASEAILSAELSTGRFDSVIIGPGLGRSPETVCAVQALLTLLKDTGLPVIVDADALFALSRQAIPLSDQAILTPHVGECANLLGWETGAVHHNLLQAAQAVRERFQASVVLKAATTVIAPALPPGSLEQEQPLYLSPTGNPGMATAGCGDVLSGVIGGLVGQRHAQKHSIWPAAPLGVYLHGLAGDQAAQWRTCHALRASDVTQALPAGFRLILGETNAPHPTPFSTGVQ